MIHVFLQDRCVWGQSFVPAHFCDVMDGKSNVHLHRGDNSTGETSKVKPASEYYGNIICLKFLSNDWLWWTAVVMTKNKQTCATISLKETTSALLVY